jgi:HTH-type transcriptional regulator/antitoxin HigA
MQAFRIDAIRAIRTRSEYDAALREAERLVESDPSPRSEAGARLEGLAILIEAYEATQWPTEETDARDIVEFMMDQRDLTRTHLARLMGGKSRVSEFLAGKRDLSLAQIIRLSETLRIPAALLLPRPSRRKTKRD